MKAKQTLFKNKSMIALLASAVFFASCSKSDTTTFPETTSGQEMPMTTDEGSIGATATRTGILLENTFEASPFTGFSLGGHQYCCDYSITHVAAPDGIGKALKYDLRSSDAVVSGSKRAEIELASGGNVGATAERWYGLRYWLQKYDTDGGAESILQWHDVDKTTPPLSLQVLNGRLRMTQSFTGSNTHSDLGIATTGKWINIVIHVKWSTGTSGLLEVWRDGTKMVGKANVRTQSAGGSYLKVGINKWSWAPGGGSSTATQRIFFIDEFRMGNETSNYESVAPGGTTTTPPTTPPPTTPPPTDKPNAAPTVTIASVAPITLPTNTLTLKATAADTDGTIASYYWSKVSGGSAWSNILNQSTINISQLVAGTYVFNVKVTDNAGASANANVTVVVNPTGTTTPPPTTPPPTTPPPTTPPPTGGYGTLSFQTGYDNSGDVNTNQGMYNSISRSIFKSGTGSFRSEVRGSQSSQSSGYRGEMQYNGSTYNPTEGVIEYDVYYENWAAVSGGGHSIQWHPNSSTGSAVLSLQNYGGRFNVVRSINGTNTHQSGSLMSVTPNKWYNFRWEVKWSATSGYIRLYIDGNLYYSYTGRTADNTGTPYLKVGQNRWNMVSGQNTIVYYDNLKIYRK